MYIHVCVYLIPPKNALLGWYGSLEYIHSKVVEMIAVWELINVLSVIQCRNEQTCMFVYRRCRGVWHPGGRHPRGDLLRGSYHHLITIRVYGFIVPQILIPVAKLRSILPPVCFLFYRGGYLFIDQDLQHPTPIPLWVPYILSKLTFWVAILVIAPSCFVESFEWWVPISLLILQACNAVVFIYIVGRVHAIPEIIKEDNATNT